MPRECCSPIRLRVHAQTRAALDRGLPTPTTASRPASPPPQCVGVHAGSVSLGSAHVAQDVKKLEQEDAATFMLSVLRCGIADPTDVDEDLTDFINFLEEDLMNK